MARQTTTYREFFIQKGKTSGLIRMSALTPAAWNALKGAYGLNTPREVTFKRGQVKSISGAKKVVKEIYDHQDAFMQQQQTLTRRALRSSSMGRTRKGSM